MGPGLRPEGDPSSLRSVNIDTIPPIFLSPRLDLKDDEIREKADFLTSWSVFQRDQLDVPAVHFDPDAVQSVDPGK